MRPVFAHLSDETSRTYGLVLASAGIPYRLEPGDRLWTIWVSPIHHGEAVKAVGLYLSENPDLPPIKNKRAAAGIRTCSALFVVPILALIHWAIIPGYEHQVFVETFGSDARQIVDGAVYRCVTALLLHKDWPHVFNNVVGLALFGTVAASISGWGMGWLMILASGALGNWITALWYNDAHLAIGASTAVFGALGLCVAMNIWHHVRSRPSSWRMWFPLAGGLALLGFLGSAPHSDLMAHLCGFLSGVLIGAGYGAVCRQVPGTVVQTTAAAVGVVVVFGCLVYGGLAG